MGYCYLHYRLFPEFVRAAILVTDIKTKPVEFRITSKVDLDQLQKIVYGETLKNALLVEKIGKELLESVQTGFDAVLVREKELLNLREFSKKPVLLVEKFDEFRGLDRFSFKLQSQNPKFSSVVVKFLPNDEEAAKRIFKGLQETFRQHNILEPFDRIERAIEFMNQREGDV